MSAMQKTDMQKTELIAEIAQGYEGIPHQTILLAKGAIKAGADAVKFQLVYADELATPDYLHYPLFKQLELPTEVWQTIANDVHSAGRRLYFDVFGQKSLSIASSLKADGIKLSTTEFYNEALFKQVLETSPRVFISIGGIPVEDIDALIVREKLQPSEQICFMYGFQAEPTPMASNHLARLKSLKQRFAGFKFGFMDHSLGGASEEAFGLPLMALGAGIDCIEKHMTLDYALELEDYVSALSPTRFAEFVKMIRFFEPAIGSDSLVLTSAEREYAAKATKVAVALRKVDAGVVLTANDVGLKRVGTQHAPIRVFRRLADVLGKKTARDFSKDEPLDDIQL